MDLRVHAATITSHPKTSATRNNSAASKTSRSFDAFPISVTFCFARAYHLSRSSSGILISSSGFTTPLLDYCRRSTTPPPPPDKRNSPCLDLFGGSDDDDDSQPGASAAYEEEQSSDRRRVCKPVLRNLDAKFIAPLKSPLFKRFYCKQASSNGSRKLKKIKTWTKHCSSIW